MSHIEISHRVMSSKSEIFSWSPPLWGRVKASNYLVFIFAEWGVLQRSIIANTTYYCYDKLSLVISQDILSEKSTPGLTWLHSSSTHVYTGQISRIFQGFFESKLGRKEISLSTPYGHIAGLAASLNRTKHQRCWETAIHVRLRNIQSGLGISQ